MDDGRFMENEGIDEWELVDDDKTEQRKQDFIIEIFSEYIKLTIDGNVKFGCDLLVDYYVKFEEIWCLKRAVP
jgi:hypothetical protein